MLILFKHLSFLSYILAVCAFSLVDHSILLEKLKRYGVVGQLQEWFKNYLQDRQQQVVVDGYTSTWAPVTSGVPQGSLLDLLLFIIFINDLPSALPDGSLTALYADDTKLYGSILSYLDADKLQPALTNLDSWVFTIILISSARSYQ